MIVYFAYVIYVQIEQHVQCNIYLYFFTYSIFWAKAYWFVLWFVRVCANDLMKCINNDTKQIPDALNKVVNRKFVWQSQFTTRWIILLSCQNVCCHHDYCHYSNMDQAFFIFNEDKLLSRIFLRVHFLCLKLICCLKMWDF